MAEPSPEVTRSQRDNIEIIFDFHRGIILSTVVAPRLCWITMLAMPCTKCDRYLQTSVEYSLS